MFSEQDKIALCNWAQESSTTSRAQIAILSMLSEIHSELVLIRQATEQANEEEEGATHLGDLSQPFTPGATLNGP